MVGLHRLRWLLVASLVAITALLFFPSTSPVQAQGPSSNSATGIDRSAPSKDALSPVEVTTDNMGGIPFYGVNLRVAPAQFFRSNTAALEPITLIDTVPTTYNLFAGDFVNNNFKTLYALDTVGSQLVTLNTISGNISIIGPTTLPAGTNWSGLKWDATNSTLYAMTINAAGTASSLYTINIATGAATLVGLTGTPSMIDIAISPTGQMYGIDIGNDSLYSINKATGTATLIGATGIAASFAQGMDFNDATGILYWASYTGGGVNAVATVNLATGAATSIGSFTNREVDAFAIAVPNPAGPTATPTITPGGPTLTATATRTPVPPTNTATPTATPSPRNTNVATATVPAGQQRVTYCSTAAPISIPDNAPTTGITTTITIPDAYTILDANVMLSATHTWVGDLTFRLTGNSTVRTLVARPRGNTTDGNCSSNNIDDNWVDDEGADGSFELSCTVNTNTTPAYPAGARLQGADPVNATLMTAYDGGTTAGTWSLNATDSVASDTGTLNTWCLEFLVAGNTPTATSTSAPATNTATPTPTNTTVPATNTATATATNTTVPATNTATATVTQPAGNIVTYCSTFAPVSIPDNLPTAGVTATLSIPAAATILDANLRISATHTWVGDLTMRLTNGASTVIAVARPGGTGTGAGCSSNNIDDNWVDDEGTDGAWETSCSTSSGQTPAYPAGTRMIGGDPANNTLMTAFDGASTAGTWSLYVTDSAASDTGTLNQFCMEFLVPGSTPTATATTVPATNTATATTVPATNTATATTVPATNTATATTVPATNTATATPGTGGRVCSTTPVTIPDNLPAGTTSTINVGTAGNIADINVVVSSTHSFVGDLIFNLSNGATNVTFYDRPGVPTTTFGCGGDNIPGSIADDEGSTGSWELSCGTGTPAFQPGGTYTNNNPLSAFDGQAAAGTWTLTVSDNAAADTGTLDGWCVDITTGTVPTSTPTATPTTPGQVPDINVTPNAFEETHATPQTTNDTMTIQNVGSGSLNWTIVEDNSRPFAQPNPAQPRDPNAPVARQGAANGKAVSPLVLGPIVGDGSFETGSPNAAWEEFSSNFGTPLCDAACGAGGGTGPRTGAWWSWFGGTTSAETGIVTQTVTIPNGGADLTFWLEIPATATGTNGFLSVRMDGTEVFRAEETTTGYGTYAEVSVDISAYADGGAHDLVFFSQTDAGSAVTNFFVDDVAITPTSGGQCSAPSDIPWLTVSPTSGSTAGGGSSAVTLTYNSASLAQGTYTGNLCIGSNDPDEEVVTVPITLNVGLPSAVDLSNFSSPVSSVNLGDLAAAGLLLLAGAVFVLRRK